MIMRHLPTKLGKIIFVFNFKQNKQINFIQFFILIFYLSNGKLIINANVVLKYDQNNNNQNTRDYMIQMITNRLHNITENDLNKLTIENVAINPILMLNELEIKSNFYFFLIIWCNLNN
jgi:hypothetical protein